MKEFFYPVLGNLCVLVNEVFSSHKQAKLKEGGKKAV